MRWYSVKRRSVYFEDIWVEADSPSEAKQKAREGDYDYIVNTRPVPGVPDTFPEKAHPLPDDFDPERAFV